MSDIAVPAPPALSNLPRIELVQTGDWIISSGRWKASRDDLVAAVAALDCAAVRRPVIKLGHSRDEEPLWQGNPTGAPAIGWIDNLALGNHGHTLVGDLVGMPGWLGTANDEGQTVIASAWPDRSVEGKYDFRCQIGHTHPFVLTAVALLGVTPPGVGTLKSLHDVGRLFGVDAASGDGTPVEARFDPNQPRDDDGQWTDVPGVGADAPSRGSRADRLNLASRIELRPGESLAGSAAVAGDDGDVLLAGLRTPSGPQLRVGTGIAEEDRRRWRASNRGHTVELDAAGAAELRDVVGRMAQAADEGNARRVDMWQRLTGLERQERDLIRRSFGLNKTQGRELARLDGRMAELQSRQDSVERRIGERVGRMPPDWQRRFHVAGPAEQQQILKDWYDNDPEWRGVGVPNLHQRDVRDLAAITDELGEAQTRRAELTRNPTPLSDDDAAELRRVTTEREQLDEDLRDFADGGVLLEGSIPGAWGELEYAVVMSGDPDNATAEFELAVRTPEGVATESPLTRAQLQQVADAAGELTGQAAPVEANATVAAHLPGRHDQGSHGRRYGPDGSPVRRLTRGGRRQASRTLSRLLRTLEGDAAANRPGMAGGPLVDVVRAIRDGVDGGQFTPDQALQLLSMLVFRPDVASNPTLSTALAEATGRLRDRDRRDAPNPPEAPSPPEPVRVPAPEPPTPTPRPQPQAPAGLGGVGPDLLPALRDARAGQLRPGMDTRERVQARLTGLTAQELKAVARELNIAHQRNVRKPDLVRQIVQWTVGRQLDSRAISRPAPSRIGASAPLVQVAAAADVRTGAMVALLPSEEDTQRLAVDGGEAADQLHATVLFLGDADAYPADARRAIVDAVRELATVIPPGEVDGMAVAAFNPHRPDKDTCIVLELGGDGLEDVHGLVEQAVSDVAAENGLMLPEQHSPYRPHITLEYTDDLMQVPALADRAGPVRLDRIRVAFAGENIDIPLSGEKPIVAATDGDDNQLKHYWTRDPRGLAKWATKPHPWTSLYRQLRKHVGDERAKRIASDWFHEVFGYWPGDRRHRDKVAAAGAAGSDWPIPNEEAITLPNPNPTIVHAAAKVSVDDVRTAYYRQAPNERTWIREFRAEPRELIVADDGSGGVSRVGFEIADDGTIRFSEPKKVRVEYVEYVEDEKVAASRMVYASAAESRPSIVAPPAPPPPPPGFRPSEPDEPDVPAEPDDVRAAEVSDRPWSSFDAADYSPDQWRRACLLDRGEGEEGKARFGLPVREPDGTLNRNAVHAAAGGHGIGAVKGISDDLRRATARKLVALYREIGDDPPASLLELAGMTPSASAPPETPAAEPENPTTKEDDMPLSTEVFQRLGLAEDADHDTVNAAVLAALDKADTAPDPTEVAAAAAEKDELAKEVDLLKGRVEAMSAKLAESEADKAAKVKASVLDEAQAKGKFTAHEREQWERDYDEAPGAVTRVLASIADYSAVPLEVTGSVGDPSRVDAAAEAEYAEFDRLFSTPVPTA